MVDQLLAELDQTGTLRVKPHDADKNVAEK